MNILLTCSDSIFTKQNTSNDTAAALAELQTKEVRWHYSNHFMAECEGEEVIEDLLKHAYTKKQSTILGSQLKDEKAHANLFQGIIDKIGLDENAFKYAKAYSRLVKEQKTLAEKVFVFQIITEATSSAYCSWRLKYFQNNPFSDVDEVVLSDERRHLKMGHSMINLCDPDELTTCLNKERRSELLKSMNEICKLTGPQELASSILKTVPETIDLNKRSQLDRMVTKSILDEVRSVNQTLDSTLVRI